MPPETRNRMFPKVAIERDTDSEQSSSSDEEDNDVVSEPEDEEIVKEEEHFSEQEEEEEVKEGKGKQVKLQQASTSTSTSTKRKNERAPITISLKKRCKVCKGTGHEAGFKGATYIDCPMKPCFLCKMPGHTTMSCPHRVATEHGVSPAPRKHANNSLEYVFERQLKSRIPAIKPEFVIPDQVNCAVIRYHSRRVTCLEFHPTNNNILLSGDKKGQLGVWDFAKVHEKTVYGNIHGCILNNMKFNPANDGTVYGASSDGTVSFTDLETGISLSLMNLNPNGWQGPTTWKMIYGMDINTERGVALVADNFGYLHMIDMRSNQVIGESILIHKKGSKVTGLHCNPLQPDLLMSCGNDHFARLWDMRQLKAGSSLCNLAHKRVVNSAYFSPQSGSKILTTSQDNRIRVWDSIFGNLDSPSREIVHSHDFNRHLTPFRAEWDPKDPSESLVVVGRYISENYNGAALHPVDFIDISTGQLVAEVMDPNITTISPVNKIHSRDDVLATGSSRSIFIWRPKDSFEAAEPMEEKKIVICGGPPGKKPKSKFGEYDDDSDNDKFTSKGKKAKPKKPYLKSASSTYKK